MGRERTFDAYDVGRDTFVFERGLSRRLAERPSVLVVSKDELKRRSTGHVMTLTTGNHSVAAFPLLDGRFWGLSAISASRRSEVLTSKVLCANVVDGRFEISQREVSTADLVVHDDWLLRGCGFGLGDVIMSERNEMTLEHYRRLGQEWRVKPLAWTDREMRVALAASRKRISSSIGYYHSSRGVHLLTFPEFLRFAALAEKDPDAFVRGLREMVSVYEGNRQSFTRMPKYRGHNEIEFFGLRRGVSQEKLVPALEQLMEAIVLGRLGQLGVIQRIREIVSLYRSLLSRPELADEHSPVFVETVYMYVTGEIYAVVGEGSTPAFDDRRTALPGATFVDGRPEMHAGADERTEILLSNLRAMMSKDETVEYANVYELRNEDGERPLGKGATREVVYKTNRRPLENSLIEKRLSSDQPGYCSYMLARIGAMRAFGLGMSDRYMLLKRRAGKHGGDVDYYIRSRCEGEPLDAIPATYFRKTDGMSGEDEQVVAGVAALMGDAAAQNLMMKKYDPRTESPLFGVGKEIYEFAYDVVRGRVFPKNVTCCSIRGSFGWPCLDHSDENLLAMDNFYMGHYALALKAFQRCHRVPIRELAESFMDGFEFRTHALAWRLSVMRDRFETFEPKIPSRYGFSSRWRFVMWSLERQEQDLSLLKRLFFAKVKVEEDEDIRNNPQ